MQYFYDVINKFYSTKTFLRLINNQSSLNVFSSKLVILMSQALTKDSKLCKIPVLRGNKSTEKFAGSTILSYELDLAICIVSLNHHLNDLRVAFESILEKK